VKTHLRMIVAAVVLIAPNVVFADGNRRDHGADGSNTNVNAEAHAHASATGGAGGNGGNGGSANGNSSNVSVSVLATRPMAAEQQWNMAVATRSRRHQRWSLRH